MDLRDLRPPVEDGPFTPPAYLPPITEAGVRGARSLTGLTYGVVRGFRPMTLDLHLPLAAQGPVPVVLWIHGGGWSEGDRRLVPLQWGQQLLFDKVIAAGMAFATLDYRLLGEAPFLACVHDCVAAVRYLHRYAAGLGVDATRLGVWGESAGAQLAAMVAFLGTGPDRLDGLLEPPPDGRADALFGPSCAPGSSTSPDRGRRPSRTADPDRHSEDADGESPQARIAPLEAQVRRSQDDKRMLGSGRVGSAIQDADQGAFDDRAHGKAVDRRQPLARR